MRIVWISYTYRAYEAVAKLYLNEAGTFVEARDMPFAGVHSGAVTIADVLIAGLGSDDLLQTTTLYLN